MIEKSNLTDFCQKELHYYVFINSNGIFNDESKEVEDILNHNAKDD